MKYGCIGEHLKHSFSKEIHAALANYAYDITEIPRGELDRFMTERNFLGINVTIPYKEAVIPHLHYIDDAAKSIGAVNTVVNRGGLLYGYNTDFYGMKKLIAHAGIDLGGKKVAILGTGGTSKTATAVAESLGSREILRVSRSKKDGAITYGELYSLHTDAEIIINTTPSGMYPNTRDVPVELDKFCSLTGVIDAIYNPLRSRLITEAKKRGIPSDGGLYMLVAQAVRASEIFTDKEYPESEIERVYKCILSCKENIVLIGMPASGKSTVGRLLSEMTGRRLIDTDTMIEESAELSIPKIFERYGEGHFRLLEREAIESAGALTSVIIATGGGAVLKEENVDLLRQNGRLFFIDRPPQNLIPTTDRPLANDRTAIEKRYKERYPIYRAVCDVRIDADCDPQEVAETIIGETDK